MKCLENLNEEAQKVLDSLKYFIENKDRLEKAIEEKLPEMDAECAHRALFYLSLIRRFYIARQGGWVYIVKKFGKCLSKLPDDAEVNKQFKVVVIPDPLREGKGAEFEACLRKSDIEFLKFAWVGW